MVMFALLILTLLFQKEKMLQAKRLMVLNLSHLSLCLQLLVSSCFSKNFQEFYSKASRFYNVTLFCFLQVIVLKPTYKKLFALKPHKHYIRHAAQNYFLIQSEEIRMNFSKVFRM